MSPTYFAVRCGDLDKHLEIARKAGDMQTVQRLLGDKTSLFRAMYGKLA